MTMSTESDAEWAKKIAEVATDALVDAGIITSVDFDKTSDIIAEEINVRLSLDDRPNN